MSSQPRTCAVCPAIIHPRNRSGYCVAHTGQSPELRRKISESLKLAHKLNPHWKEVRSRAGKAGAARPGDRERRAKLARERRLWEVGNAARTPETHAKIAKTMRAVRMAWCPPHLRDEARRLSQVKRLPHAEVKAIILAQHEAEMRRFRHALGVEEPASAAVKIVLPEKRMAPQASMGAGTDNATAAAIIASVAEAFGKPVEAIIGKSRVAELILPRFTCAYVLWRCGNSYTAVGNWLGGRDHTTAIHACRQFEALATPAMRELAARLIGDAA